MADQAKELFAKREAASHPTAAAHRESEAKKKQGTHPSQDEKKRLEQEHHDLVHGRSDKTHDEIVKEAEERIG